MRDIISMAVTMKLVPHPSKWVDSLIEAAEVGRLDTLLAGL